MASPGTPNRMEVMSPVVAVTADIPRRKAKASTPSIVKTKGSIRARVTGPPSPGSMPTEKPTAIPTSIRLKLFQASTRKKPSTEAWNISSSIIVQTDSVLFRQSHQQIL